MTYPPSPQVVTATQVLMIALTELEQSTQAGRLPEMQAGEVFWARTDQAAELVASGLAAYAPSGTQLRPEPPWTVSMTPGPARGTSNASP
jgi:hypothetical protein